MATRVESQLSTLSSCAIYSHALDAARDVADLEVPGFHLHPLKGELKGSWAVTVRANWRVVFRFADHDVFDVDFLDYH